MKLKFSKSKIRFSMLQLFLFLSFFFLNCSGSKKNIVVVPIDNNQRLIEEELVFFSGKGRITSSGFIDGSLSFSFKSKTDSAFIQVTDPIGRKVLLIWSTSTDLTARNLIQNKQYDNSEIEELLPIMKVVQPNELIKFLLGEKVQYSKRDKSIPSEIRKNIDLRFESEKGLPYSIIDFHDNLLDQKIKIQIKSRNINKEKVFLKKYWKLLKY